MTSVSVKNINAPINITGNNLNSCNVNNVCNTQVGVSNNHSSCKNSIDDRLKDAKAHCQPLGIRFTELRENVYKIILNADFPLGAYDIINIMQSQEANIDVNQPTHKKSKVIAPPTVYRSLQFLIEHGFIHRLVSTNTFVPCCHPRSNHIAGFLICDECHQVQECSDETLLSLIRHTRDDIGFKVKTSMIEMTGICTDCQLKRTS